MILGMHRSGTSAVAGAIDVLGADRPASMLDGGPSNPLGYFEAYSVIHVNDWILRRAGCTWYDSLGFDPEALDPVTRKSAMTLIHLAIGAEFTDASLLLLKDPRLCLLLDYWLPMLDAMHIEPAVVFVLRHPAEVIASLGQRDAFPPPLAAAAWLQHVLAAEYATRGRRRAFVTYEELLTDWRSCLVRVGQQAQIDWPVAFDTVADRMVQRLPHALRHHQTAMIDAKVPASLVLLMQTALDTLPALCAGESPPARQRLDEIRGASTTWRAAQGLALARKLLDGHALRGLPREVIPDDWLQIAAGLARSV